MMTAMSPRRAARRDYDAADYDDESAKMTAVSHQLSAPAAGYHHYMLSPPQAGGRASCRQPQAHIIS